MNSDRADFIVYRHLCISDPRFPENGKVELVFSPREGSLSHDKCKYLPLSAHQYLRSGQGQFSCVWHHLSWIHLLIDHYFLYSLVMKSCTHLSLVDAVSDHKSTWMFIFWKCGGFIVWHPSSSVTQALDGFSGTCIYISLDFLVAVTGFKSDVTVPVDEVGDALIRWDSYENFNALLDNNTLEGM